MNTFIPHRRAPRFLQALAAAFLFSAISLPLSAAVTIQSWQTPNGAKVFFVETHAIPVLDISVDFDAGSRHDSEKKSGLASLTNMMLARGVAARPEDAALTEAQISDAFADIGAEFSGSVSADRAGLVLRTLSSEKEAARAVQVLARLLAEPSFPDDLLKRDKKRAISAIREALTRPDAIASRAFMKEIYGSHPYAFSPTPESLAAITRQDIAAFYRRHYVADTAVITIVGDATRERAGAIADALSRRLKNAAAGKAAGQFPEVLAVARQDRFIEHPATQSHIYVGMPAIRRGDPDFFPLMVGNYIFGGGGFVSRLMQEVREKRGLSYGVYSQFEPRLQEGPFSISLQTKKAQTTAALKVVREVFGAFMKEGPTEDELKAAKDNLIKGFPLRMDNNSKISGLVSMIGYYGLPLDYLDTWTEKVNAVTVEDIRNAFARKLPAEKLSTVVVGEPG